MNSVGTSSSRPADSRRQIVLTRSNVAWALAAVAAVLILMHLGWLFLKFGLGFDWLRGWMPLYISYFSLDEEHNIPTLFSTFLLLLNAGLFGTVWYVAPQKVRFRHAWLFCAGLFVFLALDEFLVIHEGLIKPVRQLLGTSGPLRFAWVIPYGAGVVLIALLLGPWFFRLDSTVRRWLSISAVVYLAGAVGLEMVGAWYWGGHLSKDLTYGLLTGLEETIEMAGLIVLVYSLLLAIEIYAGGVLVSIGARKSG